MGLPAVFMCFVTPRDQAESHPGGMLLGGMSIRALSLCLSVSLSLCFVWKFSCTISLSLPLFCVEILMYKIYIYLSPSILCGNSHVQSLSLSLSLSLFCEKILMYKISLSSVFCVEILMYKISLTHPCIYIYIYIYAFHFIFTHQ